MKKIQNILIVLALGAVSAKADYTLTAGASQNVTVGDNTVHTAFFNLSVTAADTLKFSSSVNLDNWTSGGGIATFGSSYTGSTGSGNLALSTSPVGVGVGNYTLAVSWTLDNTIGIGTYTGATTPVGITLALFGSDTGPGLTQGQQAWDTVSVSAVPEPAQAIASVALLGCGGLVFIGRRFVGKKA